MEAPGEQWQPQKHDTDEKRGMLTPEGDTKPLDSFSFKIQV